jgi:hypothetical protein
MTPEKDAICRMHEIDQFKYTMGAELTVRDAADETHERGKIQHQIIPAIPGQRRRLALGPPSAAEHRLDQGFGGNSIADDQVRSPCLTTLPTCSNAR